jgi:hypothetical protein
MWYFKLTEKQKLFKNFFAYNLSFVLIFASFDAICATVGVLKKSECMGTITQTVLHSSNLLSSLVLPQILTTTLGFKWSLAMAEVFYLLYFASNVTFTYWILIPGSIVCGIANSIVATNLGTYFTSLSKQYAVLKSCSFKHAQSLIFGWFSSIFLTSKS